MLDKGADINAADIYGRTSLHWAVADHNVPSVQFLLDKGAKTDVRTCREEIPLHLAVIYGCEESLQLLLDKGADIHAQDCNEETPLHLAARHNNPGAIRLLLRKGAKVDATNHDGETAFELAISTKNPEPAQLLLEQGAKSDCDENPLHKAAAHNHTSEIEQLLRANSTLINIKDKNGKIPLHWAAEMDRPEAIQLLLDNNADLHAVDNSGKTPLHCASTRAHLQSARLLVIRGANVNAPDHKGNTPLFYVMLLDHAIFNSRKPIDCEVIQLLLDNHANIDATDSDGRTLLDHAVTVPSVQAARFLLEKGANVNATNSTGETPLHLLVKNIHTNGYCLQDDAEKILELLLKSGANINALDSTGKTPLHYAELGLLSSEDVQKLNFKYKCVQRLLENGAIALLEDSSLIPRENLYSGPRDNLAFLKKNLPFLPQGTNESPEIVYFYRGSYLTTVAEFESTMSGKDLRNESLYTIMRYANIEKIHPKIKQLVQKAALESKLTRLYEAAIATCQETVLDKQKAPMDKEGRFQWAFNIFKALEVSNPGGGYTHVLAKLVK